MKDFNYSVLILGYKRPAQVERILTLCLDIGIKSIFVSIDGVAKSDHEGQTKNSEIKTLIAKYQEMYPLIIRSNFNTENYGCAVSVLASVDWFFRHNNYGAILEDDCIPSPSFFEFVRAAEVPLSNRSDIWLACGTQFAPPELFKNEWLLSRFSLTWGWATSAAKWSQIRAAITQSTPSKLNLSPSSAFWNSGAKRALEGRTDVWDTILVNVLQAKKKFALLPKRNLILNIGSDLVATHDQTHSLWTNRDTGIFNSVDLAPPRYSREVDDWLKKNFYRIRLRHILTTQITRLIDVANRTRRFDSPLIDRWNNVVKRGCFD